MTKHPPLRTWYVAQDTKAFLIGLWTRWTRTGEFLYGAVDGNGSVDLPCRPEAVDVASAAMPDGTAIAAQVTDRGIRVDLPAIAAGGPAVVRFRLR